jgi:putative intracellular protease/amidase
VLAAVTATTAAWLRSQAKTKGDERMSEQDPDFRDPRAEADQIARALRAQVVMVPQAGHYPQSQRPDITTGAVLRFLESVNGRA